ncbi:MAG: hypothetical protein ACI8PD_001461 [Nitrospinales bacterium]|jgi:hypothetical protein
MATFTGTGINEDIKDRILSFLNSANYAPSIAGKEPKSGPVFDDPDKGYGDQIKDYDIGVTVATRIIEKRDSLPGNQFTSLAELSNISGFGQDKYDDLLYTFGNSRYGQWNLMPYNIPGVQGVLHAAFLKNETVIFISKDGQINPIWDPSDEDNAQFSNASNQPTHSLVCSGHCLLSDGRLLVVGGGGFSSSDARDEGYIYDPNTNAWTQTSGQMSEAKWYPTAVTIGDQKVIVTCGDTRGHMDLFDETTGTFTDMTGDDKTFSNLYPGLHLLPCNNIFYSRTGWGAAGDDSPRSNDDSAYFCYDGTEVSWTNIVPSSINRAKGISVLILQNSSPTARVLVVGGSDSSGNGLNSAEIIDVLNISSSSCWEPTGALPDSLDRRQCNAVILPDNTVFVAGGSGSSESPSMLYHPNSNSWTGMDDLPGVVRNYHSVMVLLPSGKVMMAGDHNDSSIAVFSPPYLFKGDRPTLSDVPATIHHGDGFEFDVTQRDDIRKVVLVKPMAVTHQTDSEQRVVELVFSSDPNNANRMCATSPNGDHPHPKAPRGHYMLFALNRKGVPSEGKFVHLH